MGKTITLDDVQIVNGLQTTVTIYNYFADKDSIEEKDRNRSILIRILVTTDPTKRDRIIKATNFQTAVTVASLKATDPLQRDIEEYLIKHGLYYDRRKNYYKNIGKPADKIINIPYLAQAVMAVILRKPDYARARPTTIIKRPEDCDQIFNSSIALPVYLACARIVKQVEAFIHDYASDISMRDKTDLKFHIVMVLVAKLLSNKEYGVSDLEKLFDVEAPQELIDDVVHSVVDLGKSYSEEQELPIERIVKTREFVSHIIDKIEV